MDGIWQSSINGKALKMYLKISLKSQEILEYQKNNTRNEVQTRQYEILYE